MLLSCEQKPEECDATVVDSSNAAGLIPNSSSFILLLDAIINSFMHFPKILSLPQIPVQTIPVQTIISCITFPATSVKRNGRPWNGYVNSS